MTIDLEALECRVDSCLGQTIIISTAKVHELIQRLREAEKDAARWELASKSRNYGITCWNEYGQRTVYDDLAAGLIDAEIEQQRKIATGEDFGL